MQTIPVALYSTETFNTPLYESKMPVLTPRSSGVEKYLASVSSERTKPHSTMPLSPLSACRHELTKRFPAYAIDSVADPYTAGYGMLHQVAAKIWILAIMTRLHETSNQQTVHSDHCQIRHISPTALLPKARVTHTTFYSTTNRHTKLLNTDRGPNIKLAINSLPLTLHRPLVNFLTFLWQLSNSPTFPSLPSSRTQDLALQQILSSIDLFLSYRTDSTNSRTL